MGEAFVDDVGDGGCDVVVASSVAEEDGVLGSAAAEVVGAVVVVVLLAVVGAGVLAVELVLTFGEPVDVTSLVGVAPLQADKTHTATALTLALARMFPMDGH